MADVVETHSDTFQARMERLHLRVKATNRPGRIPLPAKRPQNPPRQQRGECEQKYRGKNAILSHPDQPPRDRNEMPQDMQDDHSQTKPGGRSKNQREYQDIPGQHCRNHQERVHQENPSRDGIGLNNSRAIPLPIFLRLEIERHRKVRNRQKDRHQQQSGGKPRRDPAIKLAHDPSRHHLVFKTSSSGYFYHCAVAI